MKEFHCTHSLAGWTLPYRSQTFQSMAENMSAQSVFVINCERQRSPNKTLRRWCFLDNQSCNVRLKIYILHEVTLSSPPKTHTRPLSISLNIISVKVRQQERARNTPSYKSWGGGWGWGPAYFVGHRGKVEYTQTQYYHLLEKGNICNQLYDKTKVCSIRTNHNQ